jgi:hypothetical protein
LASPATRTACTQLGSHRNATSAAFPEIRWSLSKTAALSEGSDFRGRIKDLISSIDAWDVQAASVSDSDASFDFVIRKGATLEKLAAYLLRTLKGVEVTARDAVTASEEIDLALWNAGVEEVLRDWGGIIFVEFTRAPSGSWAEMGIAHEELLRIRLTRALVEIVPSSQKTTISTPTGKCAPRGYAPLTRRPPPWSHPRPSRRYPCL